jgi:hypothetical protein
MAGFAELEEVVEERRQHYGRGWALNELLATEAVHLVTGQLQFPVSRNHLSVEARTNKTAVSRVMLHTIDL